MVLDLTLTSVLTFFTILSLLAVYSILDIRDRRVKNDFVLAGGVLGCIILILTGHFVSSAILHATAILLVVPLAYVLYRIGSMGGADVKVLFVLVLVSPGIELGVWNQPVLEAIVALGGELSIMLLGGYLYWRFKRNNENVTPPLIPFLLVSYLAIQMLALL